MVRVTRRLTQSSQEEMTEDTSSSNNNRTRLAPYINVTTRRTKPSLSFGTMPQQIELATIAGLLVLLLCTTTSIEGLAFSGPSSSLPGRGGFVHSTTTRRSRIGPDRRPKDKAASGTVRTLRFTSSATALAAATDAPESSSTTTTDPSRLFARHAQRQEDINRKDDDKELTVTYLEINSWLLTLPDGTTVLVDPLLEGPLEFGMLPSWVYSASKRVLRHEENHDDTNDELPSNPTQQLLATVRPDVILLTQGLDDHAHVPTLTAIREYFSQNDNRTKPVIVAPPSARAALAAAGLLDQNTPTKNDDDNLKVLFLQHEQEWSLPSSSTTTTIRATRGALVGPPWQRRENGYLIRTNGNHGDKESHNNNNNNNNKPFSLYLEPHVEFSPRELRRVLSSNQLGGVDVVITPVTGQALTPLPRKALLSSSSLPLPQFELVHGPRATAELIRILQPKVVIPMTNGDVDATGVLAQFVQPVGDNLEEWAGALEALPTRSVGKRQQQIPRVQTAAPGKDVTVSV